MIIFESPIRAIATISRRFIPPDRFFDFLLKSRLSPTNVEIRIISSSIFNFGNPLILMEKNMICKHDFFTKIIKNNSYYHCN